MTVSAQNKIRGLQRLLQRKGDALSAEERASLESKIAALREEKSDNAEQAVKRRHENKYHMVKFFERKKITRHVDHAVKRMQRLCESLSAQQLLATLGFDGEESENETERLAKALASESAAQGERESELRGLVAAYRSLCADLQYVLYYPPQSKYVALFAGSEGEREGEGEESGPMATLRRCAMDGKTRAASDAARAAARERRQRSLGAGERDLVQHAVAVQLKLERDGERETEKQREKPAKRERETSSAERERETERDAKPAKKPRKHEKEKEKERERQRESKSENKVKQSESEREGERESSAAADAASSSSSSSGAATNGGDGFFLEEASAADLVPSAAKESEKHDYALVKHAVDRKKHNTHKKLHGHKAGGVYHADNKRNAGNKHAPRNRKF